MLRHLCSSVNFTSSPTSGRLCMQFIGMALKGFNGMSLQNLQTSTMMWLGTRRKFSISSELHSSTETSAATPVEKVKKVVRVKRANWTPQMDDALQKAVHAHQALGWKAVAKHTGLGLTVEQCRHRWMKYVSAEQKNVVRGVWSSDELRKLEDLVPQYTLKPYWSTRCKTITKERIDWTAIGKHLQRMAADCKNTYARLQGTATEQGPFTEQEDRLIIKRVTEFGPHLKGEAWTILPQELRRTRTQIIRRWSQTLKVRLSFASKLTRDPKKQLEIAQSSEARDQLRARWTEEMDRVLRVGVAEYKDTEGWDKVAEHVGHGLTAVQCRDRWFLLLDKQKVLASQQKIVWTEEQLRELEELIPQHVSKPYLSSAPGAVATKGKIDWIAIGKKLDKVPNTCKRRWQALLVERNVVGVRKKDKVPAGAGANGV